MINIPKVRAGIIAMSRDISPDRGITSWGRPPSPSRLRRATVTPAGSVGDFDLQREMRFFACDKRSFASLRMTD